MLLQDLAVGLLPTVVSGSARAAWTWWRRRRTDVPPCICVERMAITMGRKPKDEPVVGTSNHELAERLRRWRIEAGWPTLTELEFSLREQQRGDQSTEDQPAVGRSALSLAFTNPGMASLGTVDVLATELLATAVRRQGFKVKDAEAGIDKLGVWVRRMWVRAAREQNKLSLKDAEGTAKSIWKSFAEEEVTRPEVTSEIRAAIAESDLGFVDLVEGGVLVVNVHCYDEETADLLNGERMWQRAFHLQYMMLTSKFVRLDIIASSINVPGDD
ncbi:hypothetical protein ACFV6F_13000 [Kitasatospora phosalacinea]|uniref:hypothetical protein n=1 Tax=Kitasatospora phosalacinea TaxID=2065 RepID=UPI003668460D